MKTKNYKSIFSYLLASTIGLFIVSCGQEDYTDTSTFIPTAPTLSVTTSVSSKSLIEDDSVYEFTATLSTPQLVDVKLFATQIAGNATLGDDFTMDRSIVIPAGATSATGKITILSDELMEGTETVTIQIGNNKTANAQLTPATMDFTILNYTEGGLVIDMSWAMSSITTNDAGEEIDPTDFADMRLLVSTGPNNIDVINELDPDTNLPIADSPFVLNSDTLDGDYYVVADFASANSDIFRDMDLSLNFNQAGVINNLTEDFPAIINNSTYCDSYWAVLVKITKVGDTYNISRLGDFTKAPLTLDDYVGTWNGTTSYGYPTQVVTSLNLAGELQITGIGVGFIENDWGEVITDMQTLTMDVDVVNGTFTIAEAPYITTTYNGDPQPVYNLSATGDFNICAGGMNLDYDFIQDGTSYTEWLTVGNDWPPFEEHIFIN